MYKFVLHFYIFPLEIGDKIEVVAMRFIGCGQQTTKLTLARFFIAYVVTYLIDFFYRITTAYHKIRLVTGRALVIVHIVRQRTISAKQLYIM